VNGAATLPRQWLERLAARLQQPPLQPRVPLAWNGVAIGSVEPALIDSLYAHDSALRSLLTCDDGQAGVQGADLSASLCAIAQAMGTAGLAHVWRDEELGVHAPDGRLLARVERAVVRPLGIATRAVHLAGLSPDGGHWVQQRSFGKANDPGLWDTLMGGMVPASDSLEDALARETWEEAGLRLGQLQSIDHAGVVQRAGPTGDVRGGYVVERIDWYRCVVPEGVVPSNQDGEVERFALIDTPELVRMLMADEFTLEASAILASLAGP
jgi:8-oxo-dGTP pyrophosphatase MutT (NUDIX family)